MCDNAAAVAPHIASAPPSSPALFVSNKPASCSCCPPVADTLSLWGEMLILTPSVKPEPRLFISKNPFPPSLRLIYLQQTSCHHRPPSLYFVCAAVVLPPESPPPLPLPRTHPENNITSLSCASLPSVFIAVSFPDSAHRGARWRKSRGEAAAPRWWRRRPASEKVAASVGVRSSSPSPPAILSSPPRAKTCALGWLGAAHFQWAARAGGCLSASVYLHRNKPATCPSRNPLLHPRQTAGMDSINRGTLSAAGKQRLKRDWWMNGWKDG